jgi:hypothetical protein
MNLWEIVAGIVSAESQKTRHRRACGEVVASRMHPTRHRTLSGNIVLHGSDSDIEKSFGDRRSIDSDQSIFRNGRVADLYRQEEMSNIDSNCNPSGQRHTSSFSCRTQNKINVEKGYRIFVACHSETHLYGPLGVVRIPDSKTSAQGEGVSH